MEIAQNPRKGEKDGNLPRKCIFLHPGVACLDAGLCVLVISSCAESTAMYTLMKFVNLYGYLSMNMNV